MSCPDRGTRPSISPLAIVIPTLNAARRCRSLAARASRQFKHCPGDIKYDPMPPSRTGRCIGIKNSDRKAPCATRRSRPMKLRRNVRPAASRPIEQIFLRHASAFVPRSAYETEPSSCSERGCAEGNTRTEGKKQCFHGMSIFYLRSYFVAIGVGDKLQKRSIRVPKVD